MFYLVKKGDGREKILGGKDRVKRIGAGLDRVKNIGAGLRSE